MIEEFTPTFRKGDRLACLHNFPPLLFKGKIYTATQDSYLNKDGLEIIWIAYDSGLQTWLPINIFQLAEPEQPKEKQAFAPQFRMGQDLVCVNDCESEERLKENDIYVVFRDSYLDENDFECVDVLNQINDEKTTGWFVGRFDKFRAEQPKEKQVTITLDESVARELQRKVAKASRAEPCETFTEVLKALGTSMPTREVRHVHRKCAYCDSELQFSAINQLMVCQDQTNAECCALWTVSGHLVRFPDGELVEPEVKS